LKWRGESDSTGRLRFAYFPSDHPRGEKRGGGEGGKKGGGEGRTFKLPMFIAKGSAFPSPEERKERGKKKGRKEEAQGCCQPSWHLVKKGEGEGEEKKRKKSLRFARE